MRCFRSLVVVLALAFVVAGSPAPASASTSSEEYSFASKVNYERKVRGIRTLSVRSDLRDVARRHARRMADRNSIYHNSKLPYEVKAYWLELGENVGRGTSVSRIHRKFMESSAHRSNILYRRFDSMGVGVVHARGYIWVVEVFANF